MPWFSLNCWAEAGIAKKIEKNKIDIPLVGRLLNAKNT
jgi:hypothetical protein